MKKFKIIVVCLAIFVTLATLAAIGIRSILINKLSKNQEVVNIVEKAADVLNNPDVKTQIDSVLDELIAEGVVDSSKIEAIDAANAVQNSEPTEEPQKVRKPFGERTAEENAAYEKEVENRQKEKLEAEIGSTENKPAENKNQSMTERVLSAMTPAEASFTMSVYNKVDINHALSLLKTDREAAKAYVKSCLTSAEISRSFEIYRKYSYLLK